MLPLRGSVVPAKLSAGGVHVTSFQSNKECDVYIHNVFVRQTLPVFPSVVTGAATLVVDYGCICMTGFIHDAPLCAVFTDFVGDVLGSSSLRQWHVYCWYAGAIGCASSAPQVSDQVRTCEYASWTVD